MLQTLTAIPQVQRWAGDAVSAFLEDKVHSHVNVESVKLGLMGRLILDGVQIYDQKDTLMLNVSRMAVKMNYAYLLNKQIRINNAQLIGAKAKIYQTNEKEPLNMQFLIDAFSRNDSTPSAIDLKIGSVLIRRSSLCFDRLYKDLTPERFSPDHIHIHDLSLTAKISRFTSDSITAQVKKLSFREETGFIVSKLGFKLDMGRTSASLSEFTLQLPHTNIHIPYLTATYPQRDKYPTITQWLEEIIARGTVTASITPSDACSFMPQLQKLDEEIRLDISASIDHGNAILTDILLRDQTDSIRLEATSRIEKIFKNPYIFTQIDRFSSRRHLGLLPKEYKDLEISGNLTYGNHNLSTDLKAHTSIGEATIKGTLLDMKHINASISVSEYNLAAVATKVKGLGYMNMNAEMNGELPSGSTPLNLHAEGIIEEVAYNNYPFRNMPFSVSVRNHKYEAVFSLFDHNGKLSVLAQATQSVKPKWTISTFVDVEDFSPHYMHLTDKHEGESYSGSLEADFTLDNINTLNGSLNIKDFALKDADGKVFRPGDLTFTSQSDQNGQKYKIESPFLSLNAEGRFRVDQLMHSLDSINALKFALRLQDTTLIRTLAGINLKVPEQATIKGEKDQTNGRLNISASLPYFEFGNSKVRSTQLNILTNSEMLQASLSAELLTKKKPMKADINLAGRFVDSQTGKKGIQVMINNSTTVINDTTWHITPAFISYHDSVVDVRNFRIASENRFVSIEGRISKHETDTLSAELRNVDLGYVMDIVNLRGVEFDGKASGKAFARRLMSKPLADIKLKVKNFTFNKAPMGDLTATGSYGYHDKAIMLDADIEDPDVNHKTQVTGSITPGRGPGTGLDLNIKARRINLYFLNKYTSGIFTDFQGRASGWTRVFGPFKTINLEGDLKVDECRMIVDVLGTSYWLEGDSVILRPDNIWINKATAYDRYGSKNRIGHSALINAHLMHQHLTDMRYDITAVPLAMLCYDTNEKSGEDFYGTVYATGTAHLTGEPGSLNIDVNATPLKGSTLVYDATSPETITQAGFVKYVSHDQTDENKKGAGPEKEEPTSDIRLNFNLNITPDATMKLIMDKRTGDYINLEGNSHIQAQYYNKGKFQVYGTYRVERGVYKLSMQDVIHKDFTFLPDGTIVFGGDAYQAALNMKAAYTVPNVSLDDLSATSLGLSNTRVDCIMNITGMPQQPIITFDYDLPNANEDEKQMVRSMINTEEERNMQVIYLLGIGRFYNVGADATGTGSKQTSMAMNSLLSSTLSSRFNQLLTSAIGGEGNWSFGTNLRTGEEGWRQLDVEGMLSGRLLNNRLLLNGNFGYRESYYSTNNFIGDFDIQYILNSARTLSLKAYNQTNDRYFIQSSLTTQGIGLKYQKDFNNWKELFRSRKRQKKAEESQTKEQNDR